MMILKHFIIVIFFICFIFVQGSFSQNNDTQQKENDEEVTSHKTYHPDDNSTIPPGWFYCDCNENCWPLGGDTCVTNITCYSFIHQSNDQQYERKGCFSTLNQKRLNCVQFNKVSISCCQGDYCNEGSTAALFSDVDEEGTADQHSIVIGITIGVFLLLVTCTLIALYAVHQCHKNRMMKMESFRKAGRLEGGLRATVVGDSTLADWMNTATSGSGSGLPFLIQRTMARQIQLQDCIGRGRYGEVWKGSFQGETVAVKVFSSRDEQSWARETEIYNTVMLRHNNVLGYIGSDMTSKNSETEMWLVCYYHQYGSLYEFLQKRQLDHKHAITLALTAANGLAHLHTAIVGVRGKSAIAHRDIKSKNILVKNDLTCCVADLGLAVTHNQSDQTVNIPRNNHRVGTKRYMSPEVLDETINTLSFESFKQADVYSFALVLWEIMRRCTTDDGEIADIYQPPYYDVVNYDPSFEDMRLIVAQNQYRPQLSPRWFNDQIISIVGKLMTESWCHLPSRRITIHRIKKTLQRCLDMISQDQQVVDSALHIDECKSPFI